MKTIKFLLFITASFLILSANAEDYYWVGGTGYWSDINMWRTSAGNIPNEVPDGTDNVIFNEDSFTPSQIDTVFINSANPTCLSMVWSNLKDTVIMMGGNNSTNFKISGSVTLHPLLSNRYIGKISFISDQPGNTITCAGSKFSSSLYFEGYGEWILQDDLIMYDSTDLYYILSGNEPLDPNPVLYHSNGRFDANNKNIISRGVQTIGNKIREFDLENCEALVIGSWVLNAENLLFKGNGSYLKISGNMTNTKGTEIFYHYIDFISGNSNLRNIDIRTFHDRTHFLGSGTIDGDKNPGTEGMVTMDTLIFNGAWSMMGPIECRVVGPNHDIYYTRCDSVGDPLPVPLKFDVYNGNFHRIDAFGSYLADVFYESLRSEFMGSDNNCDSVNFYKQTCAFLGENTVNNLLLIGSTSILGAEYGGETDFNHVILGGDSYIIGNNNIEKLTLNSGYWYQVQEDSLIIPGNILSNSYIQNIAEIEVAGECNNGLSLLTSRKEGRKAIINIASGTSTEYLQIQDIKNIGATLNVFNAIDAGNNEGINFQSYLAPRDLYWVNGQGDWSSNFHWATSSGGSGNNCPPTSLDNVYFDSNSGFGGEEDTVMFNVKHGHCKDFVWVDGINGPLYFASADTIIDSTWDVTIGEYVVDTSVGIAFDTTSLHIWGKFELDPEMTFQYYGDLYFESVDDPEGEYNIIDFIYSDENGVPAWKSYCDVFFSGENGKWEIITDWENSDSIYFVTGDIKVRDMAALKDTNIWSMGAFSSRDSLDRTLQLLGKTLVIVHRYGANGWEVNATPSYTGDEKFILDCGKSTIRALGDWYTPPPPAPPGLCHIRTYGGELKYWNIEFGLGGNGIQSELRSESKCTYNLVDAYDSQVKLLMNGIIDTLTFHETSNFSLLNDKYWINFLMSYGDQDSLVKNSEIDTAFLFGRTNIFGGLQIGYLESHKLTNFRLANTIDTAYLLGDANIFGQNTFSQLVLGPEKRFTFKALTAKAAMDTTFILDDFLAMGDCDDPIRIQSDSTGVQAIIYYKAQNPSQPDEFANYISIKDLKIITDGNEVFDAFHAINLGNNSNWNFIEYTPADFFWIGGEGKWGDLQHWSYTSGGPPTPDGCVPRENNIVYFDDNSFEKHNDVVMIDKTNAYCDDMYWIHSEDLFKPIFFSFDTANLNIFGSMYLNESMDYMFNGEIHFDWYDDGSGVQSIDEFDHKKHVILNNIVLEGVEDIISLNDDLETVPAATIIHKFGEFRLNEHDIVAGGYKSTYWPGERFLDMHSSTISLIRSSDRVWWVNPTNYTLNSENSTIRTTSDDGEGVIVTEKGSFLKYNNIRLESTFDSLVNAYNQVEYNRVSLVGVGGVLGGNFIADSVIMAGVSSNMINNSETNVVLVQGNQSLIKDHHNINRCISTAYTILKSNKRMGAPDPLPGNYFKYCEFNKNADYYGVNQFDTLVMFPGSAASGNQGNFFKFEFDQEQIVYDSLYLRGNQCANITIYSSHSPDYGYIRKDTGLFDVSCDYINIYDVAATSDNIQFYTGLNSSLPDPINPPPGWIYDNAQGYIFGFNGRTERFCDGVEYTIKANNFNGDPLTQYFWEDSPYPGDDELTVTEPGTYNIWVKYDDECWIQDYIILEVDLPPVVSIEGGPFCEGDMIDLDVSPYKPDYQYEWWNGETTPSIEAKTQYSGIYVNVIDPTNKCKGLSTQTVLVKPVPKPEDALGSDITVKYGDSVTMDAGFGDYYEWTSDPSIPIANPNSRVITVPGFIDSVEYHVYVEIDGCPADGYKVVSMYPPSKLGVPTAFSPNGDNSNEVLYVEGSGFAEMDFKVFNRYGELVFHTNDKSIGWDGTYKGKPQAMDVYTYYIRVIYMDKGVAEESGNITLLR